MFKKIFLVLVIFLVFTSSGGNTIYLEEMKKVFEEQNPDIKVNIETVGYGEYFTLLQTRLAAGTAPDAYELNYENFVTYAKKGVLLDLESLFVKNKFDTSVLDNNALNAFGVEGKQYGLPAMFSDVVLFYNKDLFDKAGASYPVADWTWYDEQKAAEKIRALGDNIFGIFQPIQFWEFYKVVQQNNGSIFNDDKTKFVVNSAQNIETLQFMVDRVLKTNVIPTEAQLSGMGDWDLFKAGRVGMIVTGIWAFPDFIRDCDFEWDIAIEPGNTKKATHFFSNGLVINKDSKKAEQTFKWISFMSASKEAAKIRVDAGWELPAVTYPDVLASYLEQTLRCSSKRIRNKDKA
ncbi:sugar ABC transporter substrate-binding protein [Candidatus Atribacteria bacterium HGW-Atribacteria-1]|nr:MAG: sugar ABC transporter substrate-binding protein [Candidatus Atribacteria bacterium HGW-Atribacteria-1]